jgi:hypothetical protein
MAFDALNRPLTVKFPNCEQVTTTYDHEGLRSLIAGRRIITPVGRWVDPRLLKLGCR